MEVNFVYAMSAYHWTMMHSLSYIEFDSAALLAMLYYNKNWMRMRSLRENLSARPCRIDQAIGLGYSHHFVIQSEMKPKPIVTRLLTFSRAFSQLHVNTSSFDWLTGLSVFFVIG